jgi:two-component system, LytTR family, sensor kinase
LHRPSAYRIWTKREKRVEASTLTIVEKIRERSRPIVMHPAIFVGGFIFLGMLFGLQNWISERTWGYKISLLFLIRAWVVQYLIWGIICWMLWFWLGPLIQKADLRRILTLIVPLSALVSVGEEMIWVACFTELPLGRHLTYWSRLSFELDGEIIDNFLIFWLVILLFRGVDYYQRYREKEGAAAQLSVQLAQAQIHALRMQLNPHFLFNTMNSISSMMRIDVPAADIMLEQLSSLLRITLERGETQLIALSDEMEFMEMYLALQDRRFSGRVRQEVRVDPALHDALIPAMLLQPIVENAYSHGLSRLDRDGVLSVDVGRERGRLKVIILNTGIGLNPSPRNDVQSTGVGLANVRNRLRLHYGGQQSFSMLETGANNVQVTITFPLQFSANPTPTLTGYGV